eukprot:COSAG06_NODE_7285_length_2560_cov_1.005282_4_plen_188_part_00
MCTENLKVRAFCFPHARVCRRPQNKYEEFLWVLKGEGDEDEDEGAKGAGAGGAGGGGGSKRVRGMQAALPNREEVMVYLEMCENNVEEAVKAWEDDMDWEEVRTNQPKEAQNTEPQNLRSRIRISEHRDANKNCLISLISAAQHDCTVGTRWIDRLICPDKISQDHDTKLKQFSPRVAALLAGAAAT